MGEFSAYQSMGSQFVMPWGKVIPDIIAEWIGAHNCDLQINWGSADAINGYGRREYCTVHLFLYGERCVNCGYHTLFNVELWETSHCRKHRYVETYDEVFVYDAINATKTLEQAFEEFLKENHETFSRVGAPKNIKVCRYLRRNV